MSNDQTVIRDPGGGANQSGLRDQNARLVLSFIRRHGQLPSVEIARRSGLSAQTVSNIIRALEADNLLLRGEAIKGKVGKPSVPMALNPTGVLSLGLNIGRRSAEVTLIDFLGNHLAATSTTYAYPVTQDVLRFLTVAIDEITRTRPDARDLIVGVGISQPNRIWEWLEAVDAPAATMEEWKTFDIRAAVTKTTGLQTFLENDATAACIAELLLGHGSAYTDFGYIFLGAFVGGGLVLDGRIVSGRSRNGTALGPLPMPDGHGGTTQLLNVSSLYTLETELLRAGRDPLELRKMGDDWSSLEEVLRPWIEQTGRYLALACASIASIVDVEAIMIDGVMPEDVLDRLMSTVEMAYQGLDSTGLEEFAIKRGSVGRRARSIGAAILPIHSKFFV